MFIIWIRPPKKEGLEGLEVKARSIGFRRQNALACVCDSKGMAGLANLIKHTIRFVSGTMRRIAFSQPDALMVGARVAMATTGHWERNWPIAATPLLADRYVARCLSLGDPQACPAPVKCCGQSSLDNKMAEVC